MNYFMNNSFGNRDMLTITSLTGRSRSFEVDGLKVADVYFLASKEWKAGTMHFSLMFNGNPLVSYGIGSEIDNMADDDGNIKVWIVLRLATCPEHVAVKRRSYRDAIERGLEAYKKGEDLRNHDAEIDKMYKNL